MKNHRANLITALLLFLVLTVAVIILSCKVGAINTDGRNIFQMDEISSVPNVNDRNIVQMAEISVKEKAEKDIKPRLEAPFTSEDVELSLEGANYMGTATITHYCAELYKHTCGLGHGITASGRPVEAYLSCAVDPSVIPLGSTVIIDYGDGVLHYYRADDTGTGVDGNHVDVAVTYHDEALELGVKKAKVWWK